MSVWFYFSTSGHTRPVADTIWEQSRKNCSEHLSFFVNATYRPLFIKSRSIYSLHSIEFLWRMDRAVYQNNYFIWNGSKTFSGSNATHILHSVLHISFGLGRTTEVTAFCSWWWWSRICFFNHVIAWRRKDVGLPF